MSPTNSHTAWYEVTWPFNHENTCLEAKVKFISYDLVRFVSCYFKAVFSEKLQACKIGGPYFHVKVKQDREQICCSNKFN